jgi:thiamine phosphate synthase YjbQ (UPF0047 family)
LLSARFTSTISASRAAVAFIFTIEEVVAVTNGHLDFGTWERISWASSNGWHASLDDRRRKRVLVKIIGE